MDTSKIEGYDKMTPEQKLAALEGYEVDMSGYVEKSALDGMIDKKHFDKASSELAEYKRKLKEKMTEEEKAKEQDAERQQQWDALQNELQDLKRQNVIAGYVGKYLSLGYSQELAELTAKAMADGDTDTVFSNQQKFTAELEARLKADAAKQQQGRQDGKDSDGKGALDEMVRRLAHQAAASDMSKDLDYYTKR